jgi:hypothetical protein
MLYKGAFYPPPAGRSEGPSSRPLGRVRYIKGGARGEPCSRVPACATPAGLFDE